MQPLTAPGPPDGTSSAGHSSGSTSSASTEQKKYRGRWIWLLSGIMTFAVLAVLSLVTIVHTTRSSPEQAIIALRARTVTITQPVRALNVSSYGAPVEVTRNAGGRGPVQVTETVSYDAASNAPAVTSAVSGGLLTLAAPACADSGCSVGFSVTVPSGVAVTAASDGGNIWVSGTGAASIDSGGAQVYAAGVSGRLTVSTEGGDVNVSNVTGPADLNSGGGPVTADSITGSLRVESAGGNVTVAGVPSATLDSGGGQVYASGIAGPLAVTAEGGGVTLAGTGPATVDSGGGPVTATTVRGTFSVTSEGGEIQADGIGGSLTADTGGSPLSASGLDSAVATVTTEGGDATLAFTRAPQSVQVDSGGGNGTVTVPGGPYAVSTDSGGAPDQVTVPVSPAAAQSIRVSTEGGLLQVGSA